MDKIFDEEVENYLLDTGVSEKQIREIKLRKLKEGVKKRMKEVEKAALEGDVIAMRELTFDSNAGDEMGNDNRVINFGDIVGKDEMDIDEVTEYIDALPNKDFEPKNDTP